MNIYVSNLGFQVTSEELKSLFSEYGEVSSTKVINDKETGRSRGFAFVEMSDPDGEKAIKELDGKNVDGRAISVTKARPKSDSGSFQGGRSNRW